MVGRIRNRDQLLNGARSAAGRARRAAALDLVEQALAAVEPGSATLAGLRSFGDPPRTRRGCRLFAFGKAARGMAEAALTEWKIEDGVVLGFESGALGPLELLQGAHPLPHPDAALHGQRVLELAGTLGNEDVALVLISGGGSALLELPAPGLTLNDLQQTSAQLLACGATIEEVNAVRICLSQLKGGRLARALAPARVYNVVLSDVIDSPLPAIASGPTVCPSSNTDPRAVLRRYGLARSLPAQVVTRIESVAAQPAPRPTDFDHVRSVIAADNQTAQRALLAAARTRGLPVRSPGGHLQGEARLEGSRFYQRASAGESAVVHGGETTVILRGSGQGGRNQEFVLGAARAFQTGLLLSLGSDGIDGASPFAGALLDGSALARASKLGLEAEDFLQRNDSSRYFEAVGCGLRTGRTGTNVADICLYLP